VGSGKVRISAPARRLRHHLKAPAFHPHTYQQLLSLRVGSWARTIKKRMAVRLMPPWHIDKSIGVQHVKSPEYTMLAEHQTSGTG